MGANDAELILAFLGFGLAVGASYGFVSAVITEFAKRRREGRR